MPYTTVTVDSGTLRGIDNAGARSFLGVPYGASTGGENRFRAPQPVEPWQGVRDALLFGPSAPQGDTRPIETGRGQKLLSLLYPRAGSPVEGAAIDEDCLRLNVWTPSDASAGSDLPVLVWLHGGGFTHGSGNEMAFNGDVLAAAERLVVVTVTHRLGIMGFLDLREFGEQDSANAGMLDIVAALQWVRRNIVAFGGDPGNVTVCGQSGGSAKVSTLGAMPAAEGLFARSIMMSGPLSSANGTEDAAALRADVFAFLGVSTHDEVRELPLERLIDAQVEILRRAPLQPSGGPQAAPTLDRLPGFGPSLDTVHLPRHPFGDDAPAALAHKALMIGWTTHEAGMFLANDPAYGPEMSAATASDRIAAMPSSDGATLESLAAAYPAEAPFLLYARHFSAQMFQNGSRRIADLAAERTPNVWAYEFRQPTEVIGGILGACHSLELAYVFGTVDRIPLTGRSPERIGVSREMMHAWASFVRDGEPGWEPWSSEGRVVHPFGTSFGPDLQLPPDLDMAAPAS